MSLPIDRILWAGNDPGPHWNHLHVEGDPRFAQHEMPTNGIWTPAIGEIFDALDARYGPGEHFIIDPDAAWTHMGVFNPRFIAGTSIWSQHAGANAIDIGPYYGVEEQQKFYDFLTGKDDMAFTEHQEAVLKQLVDSLDEVGSNGTFGKYAVLHMRTHPTESTVDAAARAEASRAHKRINKLVDELHSISA